MDHALLVGVLERLRRLAGDADGVLDRQLALPREPAAQALSLHVRHGEPEPAGGLARVVDGQDVGMLEPGGEPDLALEPVIAEAGETGVQDLQRHRPVVAEVERQIDGSHAAPAELALDAVAVLERGSQCGRKVGQELSGERAGNLVAGGVGRQRQPRALSPERGL